MRANSLHFLHQPLRPVARLDDSLYRCIRKCFTRQCRVNFIPRRSRAKHVPGHRDSGRCCPAAVRYKHRHAGRPN